MMKTVELIRSKFRLQATLFQCKCHLSSKSSADSNSQEKQDVPEQKAISIQNTEAKTPVEKETIWQSPWHEREGKKYSLLRSFYTETSHTSIIKFLESPIDLSPSSIKKWFSNLKEEHEADSQLYIPERHQILGCELGAAYFVLGKGGAVKFHNDDKWIKADERGNFSLPRRYQEGMVLQAIDCSDVNLRYEGLENFRGLQNLEWLSLNSCKEIDVWCLDKISNIFSHSLLYLDLRECPKISDSALAALYKMNMLKILLLDDLWKDTVYEMVCLLLQEVNPVLAIKSE